jgi:hypothetical protein
MYLLVWRDSPTPGEIAVRGVTDSVAAHPYTLRSDIAALWDKALAVAADATVVWPVRGHAASICLLLAPEMDPSDASAVQAVSVASACAECSPLVHELVVAAHDVAVHDELLLYPLRRLAAEAHAAGLHGTVVAAVLEMVDIEAFDGDIPPPWLIAARSVTWGEDEWLCRLVRRWARRYGAGHEGVRAVVWDRAEQWFPTNKLGVDMLRVIHAAAPTTAGWVALARRRAELGAGPLGLAFGDRQADAVAAIREALLRQLPASDHAALEGWHRDLAP